MVYMYRIECLLMKEEKITFYLAVSVCDSLECTDTILHRIPTE